MVEIEVPETMPKMAYDRAIVVFSPEGRLYQVEYAYKAVENATTILGLTFKNGIALLASKSLSKLLVPESADKILKIDEHIAIGFCGFVADAHALIEFARVRAQINRITFNEPIGVKQLAKMIAARKQQYTQIGGIRPFGVSFLIAGVDEKEHLFETDPSGAMREWNAKAIGRGAKTASQILEKEYKQNMERDKALELGMRAMKNAEKKLELASVDIGIIEEKKFRKLSIEEIKKYF
ncbi:MAG: archaeal proteasome endopeptidase complex subunit alpha [Candidatus Aenigmatarchaeota archaeon]